jgi:chaperonin GroEL (HSP60 family)
MKAKVEAIASHGINVFVNRQLIYNYPESILAEKGIMTIEHADFEGVERLSLVTGGEITSTFDRPELVKLGRCDLIEEIMIGEDKVEPFYDLPKTLSHRQFSAHQILGRCGWRGMHCRIAWFYQPDGRRG